MITINYSDIIKEYNNILKYAKNTCDFFSVITELKKPYSKVPPDCAHDDLLIPLKEYMFKQLVGIRKWSNSGTNSNHKVMNVYNCNKHSIKVLLDMKSILDIDSIYPEDICFYRDSTVWLSTVTHENLSFMYQATDDDIIFLKNNNIRFSIGEKEKPFILRY